MPSPTAFRSVVVCALVTLAAVPAALAQNPQEVLQEGVELLRQQQTEAALEKFDEVLAMNEEFWPAHFYRGSALGQLQRIEEAREAFLRATELNPGFAQGHRFAAISSAQIGDFETAWEQAILAHRSGVDMTQVFDELSQVSERPADLQEKIDVVRVFVDEMDVSDMEQDQDLREAVSQQQSDLFTILQELRKSFQGSEEFGLVQQREAAELVAQIKLREIDRNSFEGELFLLEADSGDQAWRRRIEFNNLRIGEINSVMRRMLAFMEEYLAERG